VLQHFDYLGWYLNKNIAAIGILAISKAAKNKTISFINWVEI
jgi:hypothetical protein